jgi:hypothetical protein
MRDEVAALIGEALDDDAEFPAILLATLGDAVVMLAGRLDYLLARVEAVERGEILPRQAAD